MVSAACAKDVNITVANSPIAINLRISCLPTRNIFYYILEMIIKIFILQGYFIVIDIYHNKFFVRDILLHIIVVKPENISL